MSDYLKPIILYFKSLTDGSDEHNVFITAEERAAGKVIVPANVTAKADRMQVWLIGENQYGRLKKRRDFEVIGSSSIPEGFGARSRGGDGGKVIKATNLNDSGIGKKHARIFNPTR